MELLIVAGLVVVVVAIAVIAVVMRSGKPSAPGQTPPASDLPYRKVESLLSPAERSFYDVLVPVADAEKLRVFAKVRLQDLFSLPRGTDNRATYQNKIQQKHVDFVLCDAQAVVPLLAIELDDASHRRAERQARDQFVDAVYATAGLPLLRVAVKPSYAAGELAVEIRQRIAVVPSAPVAAIGAKQAEHGTVPTPPTAGTPADLKSGGEASVVPGARCPKCGGSLVERQSRQTGQHFWGCQNYPSCRHTQPMEPVPANQ